MFGNFREFLNYDHLFDGLWQNKDNDDLYLSLDFSNILNPHVLVMLLFLMFTQY